MKAQPATTIAGHAGEKAEERGLDAALGEQQGDRHDGDAGQQSRPRLGQEDHEHGEIDEHRAARSPEAPAHSDEQPEAEAERRVPQSASAFQ